MNGTVIEKNIGIGNIQSLQRTVMIIKIFGTVIEKTKKKLRKTTKEWIHKYKPEESNKKTEIHDMEESSGYTGKDKTTQVREQEDKRSIIKTIINFLKKIKSLNRDQPKLRQYKITKKSL